ncbi:MAG: hypothetical protein JEZ07_07415 [Phycisphaerae bacterium]|nr:hypothetical protein [Phycisphaerae bacterium]
MNKSLIVIILSLGLLSGSLCQGNIFTDNGNDHLWRTSFNWDPGLPGANADADMSVEGTICEVNSAYDITCRGVYVGAYGATNEMFISGGNHNFTWLNVGRGNIANSNGTFTMTGGTIETGDFIVPRQFDSGGEYMVVGKALLHGGTITVLQNFGVEDRIHGKDGGGNGTIEMKPGAKIRVADTVPAGAEYGNAHLAIVEDLLAGYIVSTDPNEGETFSNMIALSTETVDEQDYTVIQAVGTTSKQAYNPGPGSWAIEGYTLSSQTTEIKWDSVSNPYKEYLYFSEDRSKVANKDISVRTDVTRAVKPYSMGTLESGKTYYWQVQSQIMLTKHDGQIWCLRIPEAVKVDDFDTYTGSWNAEGSAASAIEDNAGLKFSPYGKNLKVTVGPGQTGAVSSVPLGADWTVLDSMGLYVDVYGNELNDASATLTVTLNDTASVTYAGSLQDVHTEANEVAVWKIPVEDFGISMDNITKIAFSVDNAAGAGDAVVHVDNIRLVAKECVERPEADVSGDCIVDLTDLEMIAQGWLTDGLGVLE